MRFFILLLLLLAGPGVAADPATVAVAFDRKVIRPVLVEGLADRATGRAVTPDDPVRIASISKLVTALGVMRLVDEGKLTLDRDVSDYLGWRLRNPAFPDEPISLRLLLSHQASLRDGGDLYIIPLDLTLRERLSDPAMWDREHGPKSRWFAYSNINFPVVASIVERVTGERFDAAISRLVLKPLSLDACFNWGTGCSANAVRNAVVLYRANGDVARDDLKGQAPLCPVVPAQDGSCDLSRYQLGANGAVFSPQGGLRISMNDLARIGQMLSNGGKAFLSARSYRELTRAQWTAKPWQIGGNGGLDEYGKSNGAFCAYGLGLQRIGSGAPGCHDDVFGDRTPRMGHSGEAYGLRSGLWWNPRTKRGLAYFTSAVPDDAPIGQSAFTAREESLVARAQR